MPHIYPFRAVTYASKGDISPQIAPPYDVLDEAPKQKLLARDKKNIVAIDLPVTPPKTVGPDAAYDQAGRTFRDWLADGTLTQSADAGLFAYEQIYTVRGKTLKRRGLFAAVGLQPFNQCSDAGGIFRHEHTIRGGVDDRSKLMNATAAQLSPVFSIFNDPQAVVARQLSAYFDQREPDFHGTTAADRVQHRVWTIAEPAAIEALQSFFLGRNLYIADGHHRYTTALSYFEQHPEHKAANHGGTCLMVLVAAEDEGMIVLPTHRVVCGLQNFSIEKFTQLIDKQSDLQLTQTSFNIADTSELKAFEDILHDAGHHAMGLVDPATGQTWVLSCTAADPLAQVLADKAEVWRKLDVAILHERIIDRLLKPAFGGESVQFKYTADLEEMRQLAQAQPSQTALAFILQPTPLQSVCDVALADEVMPPKTTYFFPKLATGLVIHRLDS